LATCAEQRLGIRFPGAAGIIESLGDETFPNRMFAAAHEMTRTHHLSAFDFSSGDRPRVLMAENAGRQPISRRIADLYAERYWRFDLANQITSPPKSNPRSTWCVRTSASEIPQLEYKSHCYTSAELSSRVCISQHDGDRQVRLNFYAPKGQDFVDGELSTIVEWSDVFLSLLVKHDHLVKAAAAKRSVSYADRLRELRAGLPPREVDICDGILQGVSSEGIALKLNVSINTVRTYRKRAYARLNISSQNELMRLISI
jgi:LuxR family transcriptional regulator, activator of tox operons